MLKRTQALVLALTTFGVVASLAGVAHAHFTLTAPPAAETDLGGGKGAPPCGPLTPASNVITPAMGGHTITVSVSEFTQHTGHYRIALSVNSRSEIPADPVATVMANGFSLAAPVETPAVFPVLADGIFDHVAGAGTATFSMPIMLPNITCAKCTLQVIEFMANHVLNTFPGGGTYYYHHCADLAITADPTLPRADAGTITDAGGGAVGGKTGADAGADARAAGGNSGNSGAGGSTTASIGGSTGNTGMGGSSGNDGLGGATGGGLGGSSAGADGGSKLAGNDSGCGCVIAGGRARFAQGGGALLLLGLLLAFRRRRR